VSVKSNRSPMIASVPMATPTITVMRRPMRRCTNSITHQGFCQSFRQSGTRNDKSQNKVTHESSLAIMGYGAEQLAKGILSFGLSDVGKKRRRNEDAYLVDDEYRVYVVADGMGGHVG